METSSQVQKDIRITHLNHWPKNLINKYIHYKSNVLWTFSWLDSVFTPALDIGIAKSGSNLVLSHPSHILCLTPSVRARKYFHGVLPCLVILYHQINLDCKSFSISEDLVETIVDLTLTFSLFGAVRRKQHTVNIICTSHLRFLWNLFLFNHERFQRNICDHETFP